MLHEYAITFKRNSAGNIRHFGDVTVNVAAEGAMDAIEQLQSGEIIGPDGRSIRENEVQTITGILRVL